MIAEIEGVIQCSFAKDLNFRFSSCSEALAEMAGADSPKQMIGKDDYQLAWRRDGDFFREKDIAILNGERCYTKLESIETKDTDNDDSKAVKETKIIITKAPLFDAEGTLLGICGSLIDVTHLSIFTKFSELDEQNRFWLGNKFDNEYLTESELIVLKGIVVDGERGVARQLNISRSTVSSHLQNIKRKFQCGTIVELRKYVIESGIIHELFGKSILDQYIKQKSQTADMKL
ncbi:MAG: LuxR C-terminal-related transcriptional regulator [Gammaproteobacteria bacterium]